MKYVVIAVCSFALGIVISFVYFNVAFASMAQSTTQAKIHHDAALIEHLDVGHTAHVRDILAISLCSNRDYLDEYSESIFWQDKEVSDRFLANTAQHCGNSD